MSVQTPPPPLGENWKSWGERLNKFITTNRDKLRHKTGGESATEDGVMMWDDTQGTIVVSKNNVWVKLKLDP